MGKKDKPKVYDFLMSIDFGICHGVIDSFNEIRFRDKVGWVGPCTVDGSTYIEKNELFGGDDGGEGGVSGTVEFYRGTWLQKMSAGLARRFGLVPDTAPGYRGVAHMFMHGSQPPGEEARTILGKPPLTSGYSGGFGPGSNDYATYEVVALSAEQRSIDSGLATFFIMEDVESPTGGSQVRSGQQ